MPDGSIGILNVGAGDTKLSFDPAKPEDRHRACAAVTEMLRLGFAILVQVGEKDGKPLYQRAEAFDPATCEYIIGGAHEQETGLDDGPPLKGEAPRKQGKRKPYTRHRVPAAKTHAVSVARSAGG